MQILNIRISVEALTGGKTKRSKDFESPTTSGVPPIAKHMNKGKVYL